MHLSNLALVSMSSDSGSTIITQPSIKKFNLINNTLIWLLNNHVLQNWVLQNLRTHCQQSYLGLFRKVRTGKSTCCHHLVLSNSV